MHGRTNTWKSKGKGHADHDSESYSPSSTESHDSSPDKKKPWTNPGPPGNDGNDDRSEQEDHQGCGGNDGGDDDGNNNSGGGGGGGGGDNNDDPPQGQGAPDTNALLANTLNNLSHSIRKLCPSSTKVKEPKAFNGSNPQKLHEFLIACSLVFSDRPDTFHCDDKMVQYASSYLKGAWFEPIIMGKVEDLLDWLHDYSAFIQELMDHFGPYDFHGDAETSLSNLSMKDSHWVTHYIVEFNKLTACTDWNEPALRDQFFPGLLLCLCTDLLHSGKPHSLMKMHLKAQKYDQAYWLMKDEVAKSAPSTSYLPKERDKDKTLATLDKKPSPSSSSQPNSSHSNSCPCYKHGTDSYIMVTWHVGQASLFFFQST